MQSTACYPANPCDLSSARSRTERGDMDDFTVSRFSWTAFGRRLFGLHERAHLSDHLLHDIGLNRADLAALQR